MKIQIFATAMLGLLAAGCTTVSMPSNNPVSARWVGQSAGKFFAAYGPPIADADKGDVTVYTWRGGYKTIRVPVKNTEDGGAKRTKQAGPTRKVYLRCQTEITAGTDYTIRSIRIVGDVPGVNGPSYCAEFLAPAAPQ